MANSIQTTASITLPKNIMLAPYRDANGDDVAFLFWDHQKHCVYMLMQMDVKTVTVLGSWHGLWDFKPTDRLNVEKGTHIDLSPTVEVALNSHYWLNNCSITISDNHKPLSFDGNITKINDECWQIMSQADNIGS